MKQNRNTLAKLPLHNMDKGFILPESKPIFRIQNLFSVEAGGGKIFVEFYVAYIVSSNSPTFIDFCYSSQSKVFEHLRSFFQSNMFLIFEISQQYP